ncbi:uncharacterized protein LOC113554922 [Rhopalosiphum maidis]|uniref:uncharacterized protein LOC113554922 n=1 Tax=Rhopalosiphum maidis TaxID=43146 RepID=UPI000EFF8336|nr:uncharacterized protein LOC113554922 [Rhopalosiphum maidis]
MISVIHTRHQAEFERRLKLIQPALDRVKLLLRHGQRQKRLVNSQIYVSGECAAWLVGRVGRFNVIDIFAMGYTPEDFTFPSNETNEEITEFYTANFTQAIDFYTDGTDSKPPIKVIFSNFDFTVVSVFINLFDTGLIFTNDCLCNYWRCTVTNDGCLIHGDVDYPQLFDVSHDKKTLMAFPKLRPKIRNFFHGNTRSREEYNGKMSVEPSRRNKYSMRLFPNTLTTTKPRDLAMSFCDYKMYCQYCKRRHNLAVKYVNLWRHKTYAMPHGYGYKAALARFKTQKTMDSYNNFYIVNHCICTNIQSASL